MIREKRPGRARRTDIRPPWRLKRSRETTLPCSSPPSRPTSASPARVPSGAAASTTRARPRGACTRSIWKVVWLSVARSAPPSAAGSPGAGRRGRGSLRGKTDRCATRRRRWRSGRSRGRSRSCRRRGSPVVGADREAAGPDVDRPRPGLADDVAAVVVDEPVVPDGGPVLLDRRRRHRHVVEAVPAVHVAQVVVDPVVDLVLHPGRRRLREPGVLVGVVAELEDVVVLVGEGHLEVVDRGRAGNSNGS